MDSNADRTTGRTALRIVFAVLLIAAGVLVGRWTKPAGQGMTDHSAHSAIAPSEEFAQIWTCSMHPQIRMPKPGNCPICGMKLVPAKAVSGDGSAVVLSDAAQRIASIEVERVARHPLAHELRTVGRIEFAEPNVANLTARVTGRVERIYADYTGVDVAQGDHLVDIYSPELVVAQEEFLLGARSLRAESTAQRSGRDEARLDSARAKLLLLGVTAEQVDELAQTGRPRLVLTVHAPIGGTVVTKHVREQTYVETGDPLYDIADLSRVWLLADIYEFELPWVARGQEARVTLEALPGEAFEGVVAFVDPSVDETTRTIKVRINLDNQRRLLKPGMFAHVTIRAALGADGKRALSLLAGKFTCPMHPEIVADGDGMCPICGMALIREPGEHVASGVERSAVVTFTCPMHPEVVSDAPGKCPKCGMDLVRVEPSDAAGRGAELLAIPATSVLDSGARRIVWVEREPGRYESAEVTLGPRAGDRYPVLAGLAEGDRVVVRGNFLLDSQSQIEGRPSLLFPKGLELGESAQAGHSGH